jgi:surface antigen
VNKKEPVKVGDTEDWSNPSSGNSGKVTVTRLFHSSGMECHSLRYDFTYKASKTPRTYNADWCKTKTGEWKIKS